MKTLIPAYGKDYTNAKAAKAAYLNGQDFILHDVMSRWHLKPCSGRDFPLEEVRIRYAKLRKVTTVSFPRG